MSKPPSTAAEQDSLANLPIYSVGDISLALKRTLESAFANVRVRGEISGFKRAASGHLYFSLKDESAVLDSVCWRGTPLKLAPEDGMEVICTGRITTYPGRSKYQIVVESMELAGEGALLKLLQDRKRKLEAEGLFAPERKKPLPFLPEVIGVVTSPTGAVIRDILHRLADRFPRRVLLWPVLVQGEGAAEQIAAAIAGFNRLAPGGPVPRPDLVIVARGGGSLEDLWAFNEEVVVRAAAASEIPLVTGVGHETDTTLVDFAADLRAPTPTAAAEMAVPVRAELLARLLDDSRRLVAAMARMLEERRQRVIGLARGLPDPRALLEAGTQRLDDKVERLRNAIDNLRERLWDRTANLAARLVLRHPRVQIEEKAAALDSTARALGVAIRPFLRELRLRLDGLAKLLDSYSYEQVLERGFALVYDAVHEPVTAAAETRAGEDVFVRFHDGEVGARITGPAGAEPKAKRTKAKTAKAADTRQRKLL
ncbi:MAG: exodeoxyribonuclease VII large subunit [Alphaproteobacteria bacterium]